MNPLSRVNAHLSFRSHQEEFPSKNENETDKRKKRRLVFPENRESKKMRLIADTSFSAPVHDPIVDTFLNHNYWNGMDSQFWNGSAIVPTNSFPPQEYPLSTRRMTHDPLNLSVMQQDLFNSGTQDILGGPVNSSTMPHVIPQDLFNSDTQETPGAPEANEKCPMKMGYLTLSQLASKIDVSIGWIHARIDQEEVLVPRASDGRGKYLIPDTEEIIEKWKALKAKDYHPMKTRGCLTISQLAAKIDVSRDWIRARIDQEELRVPQAHSGQYLIPDTEEIIEKWKTLKAKDYHPMKTRGCLTISQLARKIGVSNEWVRKRINQEGLRVPRAHANSGQYLIPDTEEIIEKWKTLKAENYDFTKSKT